MSTPGDELDQFYRQSYRRLMIGSVVICAVILCAVAAGQTSILSAVLRQVTAGYDAMDPRPITQSPVIRSAPNCRFKKSWSMAGLLPGPAASIETMIDLTGGRRG